MRDRKLYRDVKRVHTANAISKSESNEQVTQYQHEGARGTHLDVDTAWDDYGIFTEDPFVHLDVRLFDPICVVMPRGLLVCHCFFACTREVSLHASELRHFRPKKLISSHKSPRK
jgi:hypothetical protein